jgi:predicted ATP-grasp superfamily ATP-dependent carboligase
MSTDATPDPGLAHVRWSGAPALRRPVLVAAFEGWNDAGNAATTALAHLEQHWDAEPFATIDPEEFFDFSSTRPEVGFTAEGHRAITWPENRFSATDHTLGRGLAVITLAGVEPQLRWRTFVSQVIGVAQRFDVRMVLTLGALLADVPHSRPVSVFGATYDDRLIDEHDLVPSHYEGPTGIVGVLHAACHDLAIPSASLWAAVPTYLPSAPSPKAALALVHKAQDLLHVEVPVGDLERESRAYERQVDEAIAGDEDTAAYVTRLEETFDEEMADLDRSVDLIEEVERFLRDQQG